MYNHGDVILIKGGCYSYNRGMLFLCRLGILISHDANEIKK